MIFRSILLLIGLASLLSYPGHQSSTPISSPTPFRFTQDGFGFSVLRPGGQCTPPFEETSVTMTGHGNWPGFVLGNSAFGGGVFDGSYIWLIPLNSNQVIRMDPLTGTMTGYNGWPVGYDTPDEWSFAGGVFDGTYVWLIPFTASQVVRIDPSTGIMTGYSGWPVNVTNVENQDFQGGVFDGSYIWLIPSVASQVVRLDPVTGTMTGYNGWPAGLTGLGDGAFAGVTGNMTRYNRWPAGWFSGGDGDFNGAVFDGSYIWLVPYNSNQVVRIDPSTGNMTGYDGWPTGLTGIGVGSGGAFAAGVFDGSYIWLVPYNASQVVRIDPSTGNMTGYDGWPAGFSRVSSLAIPIFSAAVFNGSSIWLVPGYANEIVSIDFRCVPAPTSVPVTSSPPSTSSPTTIAPTPLPTGAPTTTATPAQTPLPTVSEAPPSTSTPTSTTTAPTPFPTGAPTTASPTFVSSAAPTNQPSLIPTTSPTIAPSPPVSPPPSVPNAQKKVVLAIVVAVGVAAALGSAAPDLILSIVLGLSDCVHPYYRVLVSDAIDVLLPLRGIINSREIMALATLLITFGLFMFLAAIYVATLKICNRCEPPASFARRYIFPVVPLSLASFYLPLFLFVSLRSAMDTTTGCIVAVINFLVVALWLGGIVFAAKRSQWARSSPRVGLGQFLRRVCVPEVATASTGHGLETVLQGVRGPLPGYPRGFAFYGRVFLVTVAQLVITLLAATVTKPCGVQTALLTVACLALALTILFVRPMAVPVLNVLLAVGYAVLAAVACAMVFESDRVVTALKFLLDAVVLGRVLISVIGRFLVRSQPMQTETTRLTETVNTAVEIELKL